MNQRAFSALEVKDLNEEQRVITGLATSPVPDRIGDVIDQFGARYAKKIPLFLYHDSRMTVGTVKLGKATEEGIPFEATIPKIAEPGKLKDRIDEAWGMVRHKLIAAVSIGFRPIQDKYEMLKSGGIKYLECEILELSLVPIPMQSLATIQTIKSFDTDTRAALGLANPITAIKALDTKQRAASGHSLNRVVRLDPHPSPGVTGTQAKPASSGPFYARETTKGNEMKISEQLAQYNAKLKAAQDSADEIMSKSAEEGRTLDEHESEQYDGFLAEVKSLGVHIDRLKAHEAAMVSKAVAVTVDAGTENEPGVGQGSVQVRSNAVVQLKSNLPAGLRFTRFALAMAHAKGNVMLAHEIAKERYKDTPEIGQVLKAAITMGGTRDLARVNKSAVTIVGTTDTAVTQYTDMENEFVDLLRPKMVLGRMNELDRIPFMSRVGRALTGVSGSFVGEGAPKPVQKQTYDNVTLGFAKVAVIVVLSDEAVRFSTIKAEMRARDDMVKGVSTYIDKRFMDPAYSGVANVSPASITNGATRVQSSGTTLAAIDVDVRSAMAMFASSDVDPSTAVWVMPATVALRLSMKRNAYDEPAFPTLTMQGGTWYGIPVIVSNSMVASGSPGELQVALVTQSEVFLADDGGVSIDMSTEASVQMNDAPSAGAQSLVSLWQANLVGIRCEQYINWAPKRASNLGIALIENTNW